MAEPAPVPIEALLAHAQWVRALAASLVRDPGAADDLAQEAWLAAMERPPDDRGPVRAWFAGVLRNLRKEDARAGTRRDHRESSAARPERSSLPGPDELAARLETARRLAALVAGLEEPLRETVLLRFWEGLSSAEIARRSGTPEGTVRWRLHRALELLRTRLDEESGGDRKAWLAALGPLAEGAATPPVPAAPPPATATAAATTGGILAMATATKALIGAAAVLAAAGLFWFGAEPRTPTTGPGPGRATALAPGTAREAATTTSPPGPDAQDPETSAATPPPAGASHRDGQRPAVDAKVTGRVVSETSAPLADVHLSIRLQDVEAAGRSRENGSFAIDFTIPGRIPIWRRDGRILYVASLVASAPGRETVGRRIEIDRGEPLAVGDVVLRPGGSIAGRIVDADGAPVAGAWVGVEDGESGVVPVEERRMWEPDSLIAGFPSSSDATGAFRMDGVPAGPIRLWAGQAGFRAGRSALVDIEASAESSGVEIRIEPERAEDRVAGRVLAPDGTAIQYVHVCVQAEGGGRKMSRSLPQSTDGTFSIPVEWPATFLVLAQDPAGRFGPVFAGPLSPGDRDVVLRFPEPRRVTLRVRTPAGDPIRKWHAHLGHGTIPFGHWVWGVQPGDHPDGAAGFLLPGFPFKLEVKADGYAQALLGPFDPETVPETIDCTLEPVAALRGKAVAGARVSAHREMPPGQKCVHNGLPALMSPEPEAEATAGADGSFVLALERRGAYFVRAEVEGSAPAEAGPIPFDPARGADPIELRCGPGGALKGRVLVAPGRSPEGTVVMLHRGDGRPLSATVGADGRFRFERLMPGRWVLAERDPRTPIGNSTWFGPGTSEFPWNCTVEEGRTTAKDLDLTGVGRAVLRGRIGCGDPPDARGWSATLLPPGHGFPEPVGGSVVLGADGAFELRPPNPGPWRVRLASPDGTLRVFDTVELATGETSWDLELAFGRVEGRLDAATRWGILWLGAGERWALTEVAPGADGTFAVPRMPSGKARLVAMTGANFVGNPDPRRWTAAREFEVTAGGTVRIE